MHPDAITTLRKLARPRSARQPWDQEAPSIAAMFGTGILADPDLPAGSWRYATVRRDTTTPRGYRVVAINAEGLLLLAPDPCPACGQPGTALTAGSGAPTVVGYRCVRNGCRHSPTAPDGQPGLDITTIEDWWGRWLHLMW